MTNRLPTICRWIFTFLTVASLLGAVVTIVMMITDPKTDYGQHAWGTMEMQLPPDMLLLNKNGAVVSITGLRADISDREQHDLVILMKRYGLPLALISTFFAAIIFDLFRRLFRNVERGESFAPRTIALMRGIGFSLVGYSLVSSIADFVLVRALREYFRNHNGLLGQGVIWNSHMPMKLSLDLSSGYSFVGSFLFAGILVLVMSEVFRQGLALKSDNDLTI